MAVGSIVPLVVVAIDAVGYMTVLRIGIDIQAFYGAVVASQVDVGIVLCTVVAVVFVVGQQLAVVLLYPQHLPEVVATVTVRSTAGSGRNFVVLVCEGEHSTTKMVVHCLPAYKVTSLYLLAINGKGWQCILLELAVTFVLLVVTVAFGVVQADVQCQVLCETVVNEQLGICLLVVVGLVFVVVGCAIVIGEHISATVVATAK